MKLARSQVALGILAGGQARRLGGADKAFAMHGGQRLVERTLVALGDGYAQVLLSYNGKREGELPAHARLVPDLRGGFPGPLAGIESLLASCTAPWLLTVPVDLAQIPRGLPEQLAKGILDGNGVHAQDAEGEQPLIALWPVASTRAAVGSALDAGERAVHRVQAILGFAVCDLSWHFGNLNTPADFA